MFCKNCGKELQPGAVFCEECGAKIGEPVRKQEPKEEPKAEPAPQPIVVQQAPVTEETLPAQYRPLGAWAYFGLTLLFSIPVVGFIFLIVFSCSRANINRRNFARSYWCWLIIALAICLIFVILMLTGVLGYNAAEWFSKLFGN